MAFACSQGEKQKEEQSETETGEESFEVSLVKVWETDTVELATPECATYNPGKNIFYISNLNRNNEDENDGFISIVNADGKIMDARWVEGLTSPLGTDFYRGHLYINDKGNIVKVDLESGEILEKISVEGAVTLNGMDIDDHGNIYSADIDGNKIFKVTPGGEASVVFEGEMLNRPNGVHIRNGELIVASSAASKLFSINLANMEIKTLVDEIGRADGVIGLDEGHFLTSSWSGEVYFISKNMQKQKILDTRDQEINAADIGFIPAENLLVVPTFYDNRLVAYKVRID